MATHGDRLGRRKGRGDWGSGAPLQQVPQHAAKTFSDFSGGFNAQMHREQVPPNSSHEMLDMRVTVENMLERYPGAAPEETLTGHDPVQIALHPALGGTSELVMFDPPYLGVKRIADTAWTDVGLTGSKRFVWTVYGESLIFMNGSGPVRKRDPGVAPVDLAAAPQGKTIATFAGRLFVGGATIEDTYEPLGVVWNAANGDPADWSGEGANFELLIDNVAEGDRIVALRPMGLNLMAVLMRKSIWLGRFTGDTIRPVDFQSRIAGVGCVNEQTARNTKEGVLFLSDTGVQLFDGNSAALVSLPINPALLPLDKSKLDQYSAVFNPLTKEYKLFTPTGTFILDMEYKRWYRSSIIARSAAFFPEQSTGVLWSDMLGTWAEQADTWADLTSSEANYGELWYLGAEAGQAKLARELEGHESFMGAALTPYWSFPFEEGPMRHWMLTYHAILFDYLGAGAVRFYLPDFYGDYVVANSRDVATADSLRTIWMPLTHSGKGLSARIEILSGNPRIGSVQLQAMLRGPRVESLYVPPTP